MGGAGGHDASRSYEVRLWNQSSSQPQPSAENEEDRDGFQRIGHGTVAVKSTMWSCPMTRSIKVGIVGELLSSWGELLGGRPSQQRNRQAGETRSSSWQTNHGEG